MVINDTSFAFPFRDKQWVGKFLIGSLFLLISYVIPVVPTIFVLGYAVRSMGFAVRTGESRLPEWDDWSDLGVKGFLSILIYFIYSLPGLVLLTSAGITYGLHCVISSLSGDGLGWGMLMPLTLVSGLLLLTSIVIAAAGVLILVAGILMSPAAIARFATTGELSAALQIGRIWAIIRSQLGSFALIWGITYGLGYIAWTVYGLLAYTVCCCCLVPFLSAPIALYMLLVEMTLFGHAYREGASVTSDAPLLLPDRTDSARAESDRSGTASPGTSDEKGTSDRKKGAAGPDKLGSAADVSELSALGLSTRTERVLQDNGFITVGQVVRALDRGDSELLSIKGFGPKSLEELKAKLKTRSGGARE